MKHPLFIATSDWHLTDTKPVCREEESDWYEAQFRVVEEILKLAKIKDTPLIIAGDIFDKAKEASTYLLTELRILFDKYELSNVYAIAGNHDEPNHNFNLLKNSCFQIAENMGIFSNLNNKGLLLEKNLFCYPFYDDFDNLEEVEDTEIYVIHQFVYAGKKPRPNAPEIGNANNILRLFPKAKIVIAGDNHDGFVYQHPVTEQILVNCGAIIRDTAAQIDYKPRVYIVYNDLSVEAHYLDISKDKITNKHIQAEKERKEKEEMFIRTISSTKDISLSFKDNLYKLAENKKCKDYVINTYEGLSSGNIGKSL